MALVSSTGGGTSTLLALIPRLYDVTGGSLRIDGLSVREFDLADLRSRVAIAFEDPTLFSASVEENVLLGTEFDREDSEPPPARLAPGDPAGLRTALRRSLRTAEAEFVYDLPEGVHTAIGEDGLSLSGGQRQRLALARAIAAAPSVLLFDDPLSALDVRTEERVTAKLREHLAGTTTLIVAHRPSTVALADRVAILHEGRIADTGTHADLLERSSIYRMVMNTPQSQQGAWTPSPPHPTRGWIGVAQRSTEDGPGTGSGRFDHLRGTSGENRVTLDKSERRFIRRRSWRLLIALSAGVRLKLLLTALSVVVAQAGQAATPLLVAWAIDWGLPQLREGNTAGMWLPGGAYILAALTAGVLTFIYTRMTAEVSQQMLLSPRAQVFRKTQQLSLDFHEDYTSGKIISRQTSDLESLRELLDGGVNSLVSGVMFMVFTSISIWVMDWRSGLVLLVAAVPILFLARWYQRNSEIAYRRTRISSAQMIAHFVETMTGIRAIQAFRRERSRNRQYRRLARVYRDHTIRSISLFGILQPSLMLLGNLTVVTVLLWGGFRVLDGVLGIGVLVALVLATKRVFQPLDMIAMFYNSLQSATAALKKVSGLLEESPSVKEAEHPVSLPTARGELEFRDAEFRYAEDGPVALKRLSLRIPAGQTVAVVGRTGAGKSTMAKLLARFYDVSSGAVTLDGVDLRDLAIADHRSHVAMVTQEAFLFSGTVRENIALGRPGASEQEIVSAADAVGAHRVIEQLVQSGLRRLLGQRTALIIAHRLSSVAIADRVLVIEDGAVIEDGPPAQLIAAGGYFAALHAAWKSSMGSSEGRP